MTAVQYTSKGDPAQVKINESLNINDYCFVYIGAKCVAVCPRFSEVGAGRYIVSRMDAVTNAGFDFGNYGLNGGSFGFESIEIPSGPEFV